MMIRVLIAFIPFVGSAGVRMIADVNQQPAYTSASPTQMVSVGAQVFYTAESRVLGRELWVTDGSEAGTRLVKDIRVGQYSSFPTHLRKVGSKVFFFADDGEHGYSLWSSDGEETSIINTVRSRPRVAVEAGGLLYYTEPSTLFSSDLLLWRSDGTPDGTELLNPMESDPVHPILYRPFPSPSFLTELDGALFFTNGGRELWRSTGTRAETVKVVDFGEGARMISMAGDSGRMWITLNRGDDMELWSWKDGVADMITLFPDGALSLGEMTVHGGQAFFVSRDSEAGVELWTSDGVVTRRLGDIQAGASSSFPRELTWWNGKLYFTADDGITGRGLWTSDGQSVWAVKTWPDAVEPETLVPTDDALFFIRDEDGEVLWRSDGTSLGTLPVKQMTTPEGNHGRTGLIAAGNDLYFQGHDGKEGFELWKSDGTFNGTTVLGDRIRTNDGVIQINPGGLTVWKNGLAFCGDDGLSGEEPWWTDGTAEGTRILRDVRPGEGDSTPARFTVAGENLFFGANDGVHGTELWRSGPDGTELIRDFNPGIRTSFVSRMHPLGDRLLFTAQDEEVTRLWSTDGETVEKIIDNVGSQLGPFDDGVLFTVREDGEEPWWTDGETTRKIKEITPGSSGSNPSWFTEVGDEAYFKAWVDWSFQLWRTDGTEVGTTAVSGWDESGPIYPLVAVGNRLFFFEEKGTFGLRLWTAQNGQAELIRQIGEPDQGYPFSFPATPYVEASGDLLFFVADDGIHGSEIWCSDGSSAGTFMVQDIRQGAMGSDPVNLKAVGGKVFFQANDGISGEELWVTDGTKVGTYLVADIALGSGGSSPGPMVLGGNHLYFSATTEDAGHEPHLLEVGEILEFEKWTENAGLEGFDATANATPHGDGIENLLKYALGIDGKSSHQSGSNGQRGQLPRVTVSKVGEERILTVEYARRVGSSLVYLAERSKNLEEGAFVPMAGEESVGPNIGGWEQVVRFEVVSDERCFGRVSVRFP